MMIDQTGKTYGLGEVKAAAKQTKCCAEKKPKDTTKAAVAVTPGEALRRLEAREERAFSRWQKLAYELECAWFERAR